MNTLPDELLLYVFKFCDIKDIKEFKHVNRRFYAILKEYESSELYANMLILNSISYLRKCFEDMDTNIESNSVITPIVMKFTIDLVACYSSTPHKNCCMCNRCFGCENCEKTFTPHIINHWNIKNKLLFLYSIGFQVTHDNNFNKFCLEWCAKSEYKIIDHYKNYSSRFNIRMELLDFITLPKEKLEIQMIKHHFENLFGECYYKYISNLEDEKQAQIELYNECNILHTSDNALIIKTNYKTLLFNCFYMYSKINCDIKDIIAQFHDINIREKKICNELFYLFGYHHNRAFYTMIDFMIRSIRGNTFNKETIDHVYDSSNFIYESLFI